ncbi:glutathione S-transferase family protein [Iodidimonas sp. MBR-22]|jgi:glutathione S-transferase|uniref:glutathione S-transferase family protein n=1 Tax=unclassified Iodidimonas TaxID=2626145 RepID=UPI0032B1FAB4
METALTRVLYHSWLDAGSRLVRIVLAEKSLEARLRLEKPWERRPDFLRLNPAGRVPVLVEDAHIFCDSIAICEYLDEAHGPLTQASDPPKEGTTGPNSLIGGDPIERAEIRRLMGWFMGKFDHEVSALLINEKLLKRFLRMGEPDSSAIRSAHHNLGIHLNYIDFLAERRHYLGGAHFSMADACAAAHLSIIDYFGDIPWDRHLAARDWYMRVKSRRSLRLILQDRIPGLTPPRHYERPDF